MRLLAVQLKAGDSVLAYDPNARKVSVRIIVRVFVNRDHDLLDVHLRTTQRTPEATVHTTAGHPWLTADCAWVNETGALRVGEPVQTEAGAAATVKACRSYLVRTQCGI